ncbi:MAG: alkaline phosphatase D family protein, partial [Pseudomonadota bacterium]
LFPGDDPEALVNDATLYENGLQAWQEYHPIAEEFYGDTGDERTAGERQLYRGQAFGDDAAIMVLDQRSFRDEQIDGVADITDVADLVRFQTESLDPTRTLLGEAQLQDLFDDLLAAEQRGVTWKFIMTPEPFQNLGLNNADSWEGYQGERVEILQFIEENSIDNVVFVAADIHATFVNQITYSEVPFGEQIETPHFEITTGSVAFDPPFGPAIVEVAFALGLIDEATFGYYNSLPIAPDDDDNPLNDRDGFVEDLFNTVTLTPNGLSPLGLDDASLIDATLVEGGWTSTHTYGWTDFDIDPETQALTVTTWGLDFYTEDEALADPEAIAALEPRIVSQFTVEATLDPTTEATTARETFEATEAANDVFVFTPESTAPRSRGERIEEFEAGDRIDLTAFGFEDIEIGRPVRGDTDTLFLREIRDDVLLTGGDGFALRVEGDIDDIVAGILLAEPEL